MGNKQPAMYKMETPVQNITFGCLSAVRIGAWVNSEVTENAMTTNGYSVVLSPEAVNAIKAKYDGKPLLVQLKRPCVCGDCCKLYCNCSCCKCNFDCPTPVLADAAVYHSLWYARQSSESMCDGFAGWAANTFLCQIPQTCSVLCVDKTSVPPEQIQLNRNVHVGNLQSLSAQAGVPPQVAMSLFGGMLTWTPASEFSAPVGQNMK